MACVVNGERVRDEKSAIVFTFMQKSNDSLLVCLLRHCIKKWFTMADNTRFSEYQHVSITWSELLQPHRRPIQFLWIFQTRWRYRSPCRWMGRCLLRRQRPLPSKKATPHPSAWWSVSPPRLKNPEKLNRASVGLEQFRPSNWHMLVFRKSSVICHCESFLYTVA